MKTRKREQHVNGKMTAQDFGWRRDYRIKAPAWRVVRYKVKYIS